jgi:hypothetical protein
LEELSGLPFPKSYPGWLRLGKGGSALELDGYCEELGVAFEYHGIQHREFVPHFHRGGAGDLEDQQARDRVKAEACEKEGVELLVVWDTDDIDTTLRKKWGAL